MCGCLENSQSINALIRARKLEKETGIAHAIVLINDKVFTGKLEDVKTFGLPYITTDKVRHENKPKKRVTKKKTKPKKEDE